MTEKLVRPFPIPRQAVLRSTLFALAKAGAELHQYNEENGTIIASIKRFHLFNQEIKVSIHEYEQTSLLELLAPNSIELLSLISAYSIRGAKAIKDDAISQWNDLIKQEHTKRKNKERVNKLVSLIPGISKKTEQHETALLVVKQTVLETIGKECKAVTCIQAGGIDLQMPSNPGMLVKNRHTDIFEIQIDPEVCRDRSSFVQSCSTCHTSVLQYSLHCSYCGKALNLEAAIRHELEPETRKRANASLRYAFLSLLPYVLAALFIIVPVIASGATISIAALTAPLVNSINGLLFAITSGALKIVLVPLILIVLPSFLLGRKAVSEGRRAGDFVKFNFNEAKVGRTRAWLGRAIGGFSVYVSVSFIVLVLVVAFRGKDF